MSNSFGTEPPVTLQLDGPSEPDPFTSDEFGAWRGMLRVHATVFRELDRRLLADHGFGIDAYGVLVTLVSAPKARSRSANWASGATSAQVESQDRSTGSRTPAWSSEAQTRPTAGAFLSGSRTKA